MYEPGSYTAWTWSPDYQQHFRSYQDANGQWQTQWESEIPRTSGIDGLTQSVQGMSIGSPESANDQAYYQNVTSTGSRSKSKAKSKPKSSRKGKEYMSYEEAEGDETEVAGSSAESAYANYGQDTASYTADEHYNEDLRNAIADSTYQNYGVYSGGEPSSYEYVPQDYDSTNAAASAAAPRKDHIAATPGEYEQLDPRYRVEPSWKFNPGEIFKVHWAEPGGGNSDRAPSVSDKEVQRDQYGGLIHVGFRRYIVIGNEVGHATCVPIFTYGGQGCTKRGVKPESHGIIRDAARSKVRPLPNEPPLGFPPVKATLYLEGERLAKESRINYSKFITVEHNVKVLFIGRINDEDYELVVDAVNQSWERKDRHRRKRHR